MASSSRITFSQLSQGSRETKCSESPDVSTRRHFLKLTLSTLATLLLFKHTANGQPMIPTPCDPQIFPEITPSPDTFPETLERKPGVILRLDPTRLLLGLKSREARKATQKFLLDSQLGLLPEGIQDDDVSESSAEKRRVNRTARRLWITSTGMPALTSPGFTTLLNRFRSDLEWIGPVYQVGDSTDERGLVCPLPHVLLIKFTPSLSRDEEDEIIKRLDRIGLRENRDKSKYLTMYRYFVMKNPLQTVYRLAAHIKRCEQRYIRETRFENMPFISNLAYVPNDPEYPSDSSRNYPGQWNMVAIEAGDRPVKNNDFSGWDISTGSPSVAVWVIDRKCDIRHPDLAGQLLTDGIDLETMLPANYGAFDPEGEEHGTWVAGVLAAAINNQDRRGNGIGIAGLAGNCRIIPLSFENESDVELANAFNYAAENWDLPDPATPGPTARVVTLSWGIEESESNLSALDTEESQIAICKCAVKGLVICAATMNSDSQAVAYPARHQDVIACGASTTPDAAGIEKRRSGSLGSNYGPELSVVAPGERIRTTNSYFNSDGTTSGRNPYTFFRATSAATPHVAGLAALLLSVKPELTNHEVRAIIERSADKINNGSYAYLPSPIHPNGAWNEEVGYGRINVLRALEMVHDPCAFVVPNQMFIQAMVGSTQLSGPSPLNIAGSYGPITISPLDTSQGDARIEVDRANEKLVLFNTHITAASPVRNFRITFCALFFPHPSSDLFYATADALRVTASGKLSTSNVPTRRNSIRVQGRVRSLSRSSALWEEIATTSFTALPHLFSPGMQSFNLNESGTSRPNSAVRLKADLLVTLGWTNTVVELGACGIHS